MGQSNSTSNRQLSPEKTEAILSGAMQEFLDRGYASTSMDRVAAAAGVSKATIYSHFQSKQDLFAALVGRLAQQKLAMLQWAQSPATQPEVPLDTLLSTVLGNILNNRHEIAFIRLIIGESGRFPELAQIFVENLAKPGFQQLTQFLVAQPHLHLSDPEATARIIIGALVHYVQISEMLHGKEIAPMDSDRLIRAIVDLVTGQTSPAGDRPPIS